MYWGHFHPFGFVFFLLIIGLLITNIVMWRRRRGVCDHSPYEALTILENRLAKGDITMDEYNDIKETLKR